MHPPGSETQKMPRQNRVNEHCQMTGLSVDSSKTKVLATEGNTFKRHTREAIEIRLPKPSLNRDNGFELANIYNTILGPLDPYEVI